MKRKNSLVMLIIMVGLLAAFWTTESSNQETNEKLLKATIFLDKEKFLVNEAIWLTIIIENISNDKTLEASADPLTGKVRIEVVTYEGDTLYGGCIIGNAVGTPPTLDPKEKDIYFVDLVGSICNYGIEHEDALHYGRLLPEGEYTLQITVRYRYQDNLTSVLSNKLKFKIEKPRGIEKKAYDLLVNGRKKCYPEQKWKEGRQIIISMIEEYPNSVYRDAAYVFISSQFNQHEKALAFIKDHPNSGLTPTVIMWATPGSGETTERKKFFEDIIKKYPNTKAAMYAENQLDKWRRGKIWVDEPID